MYAAF